MSIVYPKEKLDGVEPGVYPDMSNDEYHTGPGLSCTGVKRILRTPLHFIDPMIHPERYEKLDEKPALVFGRAAHKYLLEPDGFDAEIAILPNVNKRTNAGKATILAFTADNPGKTFITVDDFEIIQWMKETTDNSQTFKNTFADTKIEQSIFWRDVESGALLKCRPDAMKRIIMNGQTVMLCIDLKTAIDASYVGFSKAIANFSYDVQSAMYTEGIKAAHPDINNVRFLFAAIEKTPPFAVAIYVLEPESLIMGYRKFRVGVTLFNQCVETNEWCSFPDYIIPINMPKWSMSA